MYQNSWSSRESSSHVAAGPRWPADFRRGGHFGSTIGRCLTIGRKIVELKRTLLYQERQMGKAALYTAPTAQEETIRGC